MYDGITLNELDRYLFRCADIIRNTVDKTDYKDYILPLVFYKIINDTFKDRFEKNLEKYGIEKVARDPAFHSFVIPEEHLWENLRSVTDNVDQAINEAFDAVEKENQEKLAGVFRADFVEADGMSDAILRDLIEHLSTHNLSIERVSPDLLGEGYMDLVKHFAEEEGREGGEFFTPPTIVDLVVRLVNPQGTAPSVYDPTCGSAGMLIAATEQFEKNGGDRDKISLYGQEINPDIYSIAKMNMFIHDLNGNIAREDTLRNPQFTDNSHLKQFDYVVANFPFSYRNWGKEDLENDKYERFQDYHMPPKNRGDFAFILHMVKSLNDTGRIGVVVPNGVLFRSRTEKKIRKSMIEREQGELFEAIIGLPENLFQNNSIPCAILVLNKEKPKERRGKIQFIHAADKKLITSGVQIYEEKSNQNKLLPDGVDKIVETFREFKDEKRHSRVVKLDEIRENDYNFNIALYVDTTEPEEDIDVKEELKKLYELEKEEAKIKSRLKNHLEVLGYE